MTIGPRVRLERDSPTEASDVSDVLDVNGFFIVLLTGENESVVDAGIIVNSSMAEVFDGTSTAVLVVRFDRFIVDKSVRFDRVNLDISSANFIFESMEGLEKVGEEDEDVKAASETASPAAESLKED